MTKNSSQALSRVIRLALLGTLLVWPTQARANDAFKPTPDDLKAIQDVFTRLADKVAPSVVAIRTYLGPDNSRRMLRPFSQGAGLVLRSNGTILTNFHVIEDATHVVVILHDGTEHDADVVAYDNRGDLAVIKIDVHHLLAPKLCDLENVRIGHWAFALGNPFGLGNNDGSASFTVGNVSAIGRDLSGRLDPTDTRYYGNLIETSAAINPGNSGGPLFNIDGEVIGIVTAIETRSGVSEGLGFAIPITPRTRQLIDKLEHGEEVRYGFLGVTIDKRPTREKHRVGRMTVAGARVSGIVEGGPAERARLAANDIIVELDGIPIQSADHLVRIVGGTPVGSTVTARFVRDGRRRTTKVTLADRAQMPQPSGMVPPTEWRGGVFTDLTDPIRRDFELDDQEIGVVVIRVRPGSEAARSGLKRGQVVVGVNDRAIETLDEFDEALGTGRGPARLRLSTDDIIKFARE